MASKHEHTPRGTPVEQGAPSLGDDRLNALRALVPEAFGEGQEGGGRGAGGGVDFEKLKLALGGAVDEGKERYGLTWSGKAQSVRQLMLPSRATLVPDRGESVNFDTTQHVFIEGENLEVLKLLRKAYAGRVKMIYIDPPYNTGKDFIYPDNFADPLGDYLKKTGQVDEEGNWTSSVTDTDGRKHSKWLSMIYPRLLAARDLLRDDGVIFVSIDDHEVHNLRMVMNEVFGEENFVGQIGVLVNPKGRVLDRNLARTHEYIVVFARQVMSCCLGIPKSQEQIAREYPEIEGKRRYRLGELRNTHREFGRHNRKNLWYPLYVHPQTAKVGVEKKEGHDAVLPRWSDGFEGCWTWGLPKSRKLIDRLVAREVNGRWVIYRKAYSTNDDGTPVVKKVKSLWLDKVFHTGKGQAECDRLIGAGLFNAPKPVALVQLTAEMATKDDIILDFFAGSATIGQAVMRMNAQDRHTRKYIAVQAAQATDEDSKARAKGFKTIADLSVARLRAASVDIASKAKKQKADQPLLGDVAVGDLGVRIFRLTESHYKRWVGTTDQDAAKYIETMALYTDPLLPGWTPEGLLWEVASRLGYPLHSAVETLKEINGQTVYRVADPDKGTSFLACFDKSIAKDLAGRLNLTREDTFVVRDAALDDTLAANLALTCTLRTI